MAPLIPDGVYKIRNGEFSEHVADLVDGNPVGAIAACRLDGKQLRFEKVCAVLCRGPYSPVQ